MTSPLTQLAETTSPRDRARLLTLLATEQEAAGHAARARLARLVAESERMLADRDYEPHDPAWDDDAWQPLATTAYRPHRADLLERIHADWAAPRFGDAATVLLAIAETERDAVALPSPAEVDVGEREKQPRARMGLPPAPTGPALLGGIAAALVVVVGFVPSLGLKMVAATALPILILVMVVRSALRRP